MTLLELEGVTLGYGPILAVRELHLAVDEGQTVALVGRNGAGKSTTLNGVAGLLKAQAGDIRFDGRSLKARRVSEIARMGLAYIPEGRGVLSGLTVEENLQAAAYGCGLGRQGASAEVSRTLHYFPELEAKLHQRAGTLSGGEQQMMVLMRALVSHPRLLLVDEPALGLAPIMVRRVYDHLVELRRDEGLSVLLVEQYVELAIDAADRVFVLQKGELVHEGPCDDVEATTDLVAAYVG